MNNKIPWEAGKTYKLKNGEDYLVYSTNGIGEQCIHGSVEAPQGRVYLPLTAEGKDLYNSDYDLLPPALPRIKGECWLVVGSKGILAVAPTKAEADRCCFYYPVKAIIHVPYDVAEGEGL